MSTVVTSVVLDPTTLSVLPGEEAVCTVRVRNCGQVVDQFTAEVIGDAARWASTTPPSLPLFPDAAGEIRIAFRPPPAPSSTAGTVPFAVRVRSREDAAGTVIEEGRLEVLPFVVTAAELVPRTSRGRRRARQQLAIDNRGNRPVRISVEAHDVDRLLDITPSPASFTAAPGTATFVSLLVRPRKRFLVGPPQSRPYQAVCRAEDLPPVTADGAMLQDALVPGWALVAVAGLAALALLLLVLWLTVLNPAVKSAAQDAVRGPLDEQKAAAARQQAQVGQQGVAIDGLLRRIGQSPLPSPSALPSTDTQGAPHDGRLIATAGGGATSPANDPAAQFKVPDGQQLSLTDIVLENPQADAGTLRLQRDGKVVLSLQLSNFRDLDYHFVAPLLFAAGSTLSLAVHCDQPGSPATSCSDALFFGGYLRQAG